MIECFVMPLIFGDVAVAYSSVYCLVPYQQDIAVSFSRNGGVTFRKSNLLRVGWGGGSLSFPTRGHVEMTREQCIPAEFLLCTFTSEYSEALVWSFHYKMPQAGVKYTLPSNSKMTTECRFGHSPFCNALYFKNSLRS